MATSLVDADSLLAIDVGSVSTRASLFDVVEGRYRFIAAGKAQTTAAAPFFDIGEGIRQALDQLQAISGRMFIGPDEQLVVPSKPDGSGVDSVAATLSVGAPIRVVVVGLLGDVSSASAERLARTTYARVVEKIYLNDRRGTQKRIDAIIRARPDMVIIAGGTDGGASQSILNLLDAVGLANYLVPENRRPEVIYAGNAQIKDDVKMVLERFGHVHFAPNIRPALDIEHIDTAQGLVADVTRSIRGRQVAGVRELDAWAGGGLMPGAAGLGRVIRFLSKVYNPAKGVLGVDVGAAATTIAAAFSGELVEAVFPELGLGQSLDGHTAQLNPKEITRWLHKEMPAGYVEEYIANKALYPQRIPVSDEEVAIEQALARNFMRTGIGKMINVFPERAKHFHDGLMPWFEPIVASGSVLTNAPNLAQSLLTLLDGLQPTGVTTFVLDRNHLSASLGAAAAINPLLTVQVLESNTFVNLGTVISPVGEAKFGTPVIRVQVSYEDGREVTVEVKYGSIETVELPMGQVAKLKLRPLHRFDVGMGGAGRGGRLRVIGGALGVVIDARGRPIKLPSDSASRCELISRWRWALGC